MKSYAGIIACLFVFVALHAAGAVAATATISATDRADILELIAKYSFAWDAADEDGFADLFTDDAQANWYANGAEKPAIAAKGIEELRALVSSRAAVFARKGLITKHLMPNSTIESISASEAKVTTQAMIFWQLEGVDLLPRPVQAGYYYSVVVKAQGKWKFKRREVYLNGVFDVVDVYPSLR